ncbi:alpha-1-antiproteinase 2-like [Acanthochromis polyacanthus]|uniref:alpha-1-antiproteinase 2-like n=1 Tax=Acanthochromis polyacanthus TaxID=80966 RepID=UPI0022344474|nr:alpha-1-antiproteinase 2-like [Acanthochromis polyacanthus]
MYFSCIIPAGGYTVELEQNKSICELHKSSKSMLTRIKEGNGYGMSSLSSAEQTHTHSSPVKFSEPKTRPPLFAQSWTRRSEAQPLEIDVLSTPPSPHRATRTTLPQSRPAIWARMARGEAVMPAVCAFLMALLACSSVHGNQREPDRLLNTSALNAALAFEPYRDLATRTAADPGAQQQQQQNILFSPLGLASALALLCRVSGSESRSQALEALGLAANATQQSVEATVSALTDLQLGLQQEGGGASDAGIGGAGEDAGDRAGDGAEDGARLKVWSSLHVDGKPSTDFKSFLLSGHHVFNMSYETLMKDFQGSNKLILNNYVYFKGLHPFQRRHTVLRSFQLNATTTVEVPMMFMDDSSEVMMLYDTNCSATVVRLPGSDRPASLLLLPKAEVQPLEDCLSDGRMSFWLSNLKPGRAEIRLPKFQLRKSYSLERLLRNAGVSSVFSRSADFSGISQKKTLELIKAPHEVLLEVEETKSENGARPDIMLDFSVPPRITFDRPFMLIIYDDLTGLILLIGRIIDPTKV